VFLYRPAGAEREKELHEVSRPREAIGGRPGVGDEAQAREALSLVFFIRSRGAIPTCLPKVKSTRDASIPQSIVREKGLYAAEMEVSVSCVAFVLHNPEIGYNRL